MEKPPIPHLSNNISRLPDGSESLSYSEYGNLLCQEVSKVLENRFGVTLRFQSILDGQEMSSESSEAEKFFVLGSQSVDQVLGGISLLGWRSELEPELNDILDFINLSLREKLYRKFLALKESNLIQELNSKRRKPIDGQSEGQNSQAFTDGERAEASEILRFVPKFSRLRNAEGESSGLGAMVFLDGMTQKEGMREVVRIHEQTCGLALIPLVCSEVNYPEDILSFFDRLECVTVYVYEENLPPNVRLAFNNLNFVNDLEINLNSAANTLVFIRGAKEGFTF